MSLLITHALSVALACLLPTTALAIYRCEIDRRIIYTDLPCAGSQLKVDASAAPARDDSDKLSRERAELAKLQQLREQRERQDRQIRDLAARGAAAREKKCRSLALQLKWREEDLRETTLDKAVSARKRLRRAQEKYAAECR